MYPSAITIIIVVIALLVLYVTGRSLAYVFKTTEEKLRSEPSVLTELDELRRSNEKLSTMYDQLAYDHDVLGKEYDEYKANIESFYNEQNKSLQTELDAQIKTVQEAQKSYMNMRNESYGRLMRISELEKELSNIRYSCDDSFLNTVERANQLSLKCASLENTIAEFDVYKKDAQEVHDRITKLYEAEVLAKKELSSKLWHSRREVAKLKRDLISADIQIKELEEKYSSSEKELYEYESMYNSILTQYAELKIKLKAKLDAIEQAKPAPETKTDISGLEWAKWVATNKDGVIQAFELIVKKASFYPSWVTEEGNGNRLIITEAQAITLCGRVPKWSDDYPTPCL